MPLHKITLLPLEEAWEGMRGLVEGVKRGEGLGVCRDVEVWEVSYVLLEGWGGGDGHGLLMMMITWVGVRV